MADSKRFIRAAFGSAVILGSAVFGVTVMTGTYAASKNNFNKQQCTVINGNVKGLAIPGMGAVSCVCPSASSLEVLEDKQRRPGSASTEDCYIQSPQKITNFNVPTGPTPGGPTPGGPTPGGPTPGGPTPGGPSSTLGNPGNEPGSCTQCNSHVGEVGRAGENPPNGNGTQANGNPNDGTNDQTRGNSETAQN
jgi:hypothetical protein